MSEKVYDEEIAPILLKSGEICKREGIPFLASVEFEHEQGGTTAFIPDSTCFALRMAYMAIQCRGNFDQFVMMIIKYLDGRPHNSAMLKIIEKEILT